MSLKYFTGNNLDAHSTKSSGDVKTYPTSRSGDTKPTVAWFPETEPVNNADGIDAKGQGVGSKWDRMKAKVHSTSALAMKGGKARGTYCIGKYELGKMWKYRKTLKKILSATGQAAASGTPKGERNMFSDKGAGHTGTKHSKAAATDHALYPIAQAK
jgi:hypothetical protein